jgi:hypothetical protein
MQAGQSEADQVKALGMAQQEMEYRVDLFNRCGGVSDTPVFRHCICHRSDFPQIHRPICTATLCTASLSLLYAAC